VRLREWMARIASLVRPRRGDADLEAELRSHLAIAADAGRPAADGVAQAMDALRDQRGVRWIDDLVRDLRVGLRLLWRDRALSAIVFTILAVGIGSATAIYSLVDACVLRHDMPNEDRWVVVRARLAGRGRTLTFFSVPELVDASRATDVFETVGAITGTDFTLTDGDFPERVLGDDVSAEMFAIRGVAPLMGRTFRADEDRPGGPHVVVVSYPFWQHELAADPDALSRTITLNNTAYAVIGVMPPHYDLWGGLVWVPFQLDRHDTDRRTRRFWISALLRRGVTERDADARLAVIARAQSDAFAVVQPEYRDLQLTVWNVREASVGGVRGAMTVLLVAVALLLVTACANVANLLLARATARHRELSIRAALGAGRGRIVRQLLTESMLLSTTAGAAGIGLAALILPAIVGLIPAEYLTVDADVIRVNVPIACLAALVSIGTGVVFGLVPALRTSRSAGMLRDRTGGADVRTRALQYSLSTVQIALTLVVAFATVLTFEGYRAAERLALGFNPDGVVSGYVALPATKYPSADRILGFYRSALDAIGSQPGVTGVAAITDRPLGYRAVDMNMFEIRIPGRPAHDGTAAPTAVSRLVSPTYVAVAETPLVDGRSFTDADADGAAPVAMVNESFVTHFLDRGAAVGQQVVLGTRYGARNLAGSTSREQTVTIVGVVADSRQTRVIAAEVRPELFLPLAQHAMDARSMAILVRTSLDAGSAMRVVRDGLKRADPQQPVFGFDRMSDVVSRAFGARRLTLVLLLFFGTVSTSLAAIGLYAVISFGVQQRTHEIGVRLAVGASAAEIVRMVVTTGLRLGVAGVLVGVAIAVLAQRLVSAEFLEIRGADGWLVAAAAGLLLVTTAATWLPAQRAARIDPLIALREGA
jgi:predicted permease